MYAVVTYNAFEWAEQPQNCPLLQDISIPSNTWFLDSHESAPSPKRHLRAYERVWHTERLRYFVCSNRPHRILCSDCMRCGRKTALRYAERWLSFMTLAKETQDGSVFLKHFESFTTYLLVFLLNNLRSIDSCALEKRHHLLVSTRSSVLFCNSFILPQIKTRNIAISVLVCVYVCLFVRLFVRSHVSKTTCPNFTKFSVRVTWGPGSIVIWRQCNMLCFFSDFVREPACWDIARCWSKIADCDLPTCIWRFRWRWLRWNFAEIFSKRKPESLSYRTALFAWSCV